MAFDVLKLKNPTTGEIKSAPVGFSWTTLFFTFFPAFIRSDWKLGVIQLVISFFTANVSALVFAFIYNKLHIKDLIFSSGFKVVGSEKGDLQKVANTLGIELPMLQS
jgi:hypothetical protein